MLLRFLAFALVGRTLIYLIQKFPATTWLSKKWKFLEDLFSCDLCLGVWVYSIINMLSFKITYYNENESTLLGEFITGAVTSFVMHLASIGWKDKFTNMVIGYTEKR